jgi:hypothetical protein
MAIVHITRDDYSLAPRNAVPLPLTAEMASRNAYTRRWRGPRLAARAYRGRCARRPCADRLRISRGLLASPPAAENGTGGLVIWPARKGNRSATRRENIRLRLTRPHPTTSFLSFSPRKPVLALAVLSPHLFWNKSSNLVLTCPIV